MDLEILREEIDRIDYDLVRLLNQRAAIALQIGRTKTQTSLTVFDADRERMVIENICAHNKGPLTATDLQSIFTQIIYACRRLQEEQQAFA